MNPAVLYSLVAVALFGIGLFGALVLPHLVRKVLALNVMGTGVFMLLVALAHPGRSQLAPEEILPDPVPHALVLTGIVVAVSATALALALICRLHAVTGESTLPQDRGGPSAGKENRAAESDNERSG